MSDDQEDSKMIEKKTSEMVSTDAETETTPSEKDEKNMILSEDNTEMTTTVSDYTFEVTSQLGMKKSVSHHRTFFKYALCFTAFGISYWIIFSVINKQWFANFTALLSCFCESTLPIPQFVSNYRLKSIQSLSKFMVFCWLFGDIMKFFFLVDEKQPIQFILGTANIILFDVLIVGQCFLYGRKKKGDVGGLRQVLAD